jgi:hypothetical protein
VVMVKLVIIGDERTCKRFEACRLLHHSRENSGRGIRDECSCHIGIQLQISLGFHQQTQVDLLLPSSMCRSFRQSPFQDHSARDPRLSRMTLCQHHPHNFLRNPPLKLLRLTTTTTSHRPSPITKMTKINSCMSSPATSLFNSQI